jgi:hypothetical protein
LSAFADSLIFFKQVLILIFIKMAKLSNGFLGDASGKLGNVVFSKWKRIKTVRAYVGKISDANSPAQKRQRLRMSSLQSFLSPLNGTFIKMFNSNHAVNTTPWAKAIKDNMPSVDELGNIDLDNIKFGKDNLMPVKIIQSDYDPYIDRLKIKYDDPNYIASNSDFPLIACSMLGVSKKFDQPYTFNVDNLLKYMPDGYFYCEFEQANSSKTFKNFFDRGQFWLIPLADYRWDEIYESVNENTTPRPFTPLSEVEGFNTDFEYDPVPPDLLNVSFIGNTYKTYLAIYLKKDLLPKLFSTKNKISLRIRLITQNGITDLNTKNLQIHDFPFIESLKVSTNIIGLILLYNVLNDKDEQIGCFNRLYYGKDINGAVTPYFDALYKYYKTCPLSFKLDSSELGIYGNIDQLCPDFISAYESGIVTGTPSPIDYTQFEIVLISETGNTVQSTQLNKDNDFYFNSLIPNHRYYVMFKYTPELFELLGVPKCRGGKVYFLTPASVVSNHNHERVPDAVLKAIKPYLQNSNNWNIPMESYIREALFLFQTTSPNKYKKSIRQDFPIIMDGIVNI